MAPESKMPRYVVVYPDSPEARALLEREMAASLRGRRIGCSYVGSAAVAAEIRPEPRSLIERKRRELTLSGPRLLGWTQLALRRAARKRDTLHRM